MGTHKYIVRVIHRDFYWYDNIIQSYIAKSHYNYGRYFLCTVNDVNLQDCIHQNGISVFDCLQDVQIAVDFVKFSNSKFFIKHQIRELITLS